jgi:nuclear transport factor 2 (NTF2) superfamily protein
VDRPLLGRCKWERRLDYLLVKALWVFSEGRIGGRFHERRDHVWK